MRSALETTANGGNIYDIVLCNTPVPCDVRKKTELHRKCVTHLRGRCNLRFLLSGCASYVRRKRICSFTLVCNGKKGEYIYWCRQVTWSVLMRGWRGNASREKGTSVFVRDKQLYVIPFLINGHIRLHPRPAVGILQVSHPRCFTQMWVGGSAKTQLS